MAIQEQIICDNCNTVLGDPYEDNQIVTIGSNPHQMNVWFGDVGKWLLARGDGDIHLCDLTCFIDWITGWHIAQRTDEDGVQFVNYYKHCGVRWADTWDSMCDSECPECGAAITPYKSEEA